MLITLPLYRRADLAHQVVRSLITCADEVRAIGEVLLFNDSPGDLGLEAALEELQPVANAAFPCRVIRNDKNLGFVRTCNRAFAEAVERGMDVLLLNSDTIVTAGALSEMVRAALLDPMTGFVNPRSNNATLATLPYQDQFRQQPVEPARAAWHRIASLLPDVSYVPTAVGFCMLVRWAILAEFGGFDEIYGLGYNEENDLIMRAGRRGYRAVLANHAFVWHEGQGSFHLKPKAAQMETANRARLLARYPEYEALTEIYFNSAQKRAEHLLGALLPDDSGRLDVAIDFSSFHPSHNGTTEAGAQLLSSAASGWSDRYNLFVLCSQAAYDYHRYQDYGIERRDPWGPELYAAVFRIGQPYDWEVMQRLTLKAATIGISMLDTISMDSTPLYSPQLYAMWAFALEHVDLVATISDLSQAQIERRFAIPPQALRLASLLSLDPADYRLPVAPAEEAPTPAGYLFVVGNHFWHKEVASTVLALSEAQPDRRIVVLAGDADAPPPVDEGAHAPRGLERRPNVERLQAGELTAEQMGALYAGATAVIFPSHYEGFGMPVMNAFAARRPVFVRPLPVFAEMEQAMGVQANLHIFTTTVDLVAALRDPPGWIDAEVSPGLLGDAGRMADDIGGAIDAMIAKASYARIVHRIRSLQTLQDYANLRASSAPSVASKPTAARHAGVVAERAAAALFKIPGAYLLFRTIYRAGRGLARSVRAKPSVD